MKNERLFHQQIYTKETLKEFYQARAILCCCCLVAKLSLTLATPWTIASQAPLSLRFPRQEYWSGLPFPPSGDLPDPGIEPEHFVL